MDQLDLLGLHGFGPDLNGRFAHSRFEQAVPLLFTQSALHCDDSLSLSLSLSLSSADTAILSLTGYHAISADGCQSIERRYCKFQQCMASVWGMNL